MRYTEIDTTKYNSYRLKSGAVSETLEIMNSAYNKLGQLEDIEEELGIDLITLFKALRSGIHIIDDGYPYNDRVDLFYSSSIPCGFKGKVSDHYVFFKDYGKTWALTKEELESKEKEMIKNGLLTDKPQF